MTAIPPPDSWATCRTVRQVPALSMAEQDALKTCLFNLYRKYLDPLKLWQEQDAKAKTMLHQEARAGFPLLLRYKDEWPVEYVLRYSLIRSRSMLKTQARTSRKLGKRTREVSTRRKNPRSTRAARRLKEKEPSASNGPESEDETVPSYDRAPLIRGENNSAASSSCQTAEMLGDQTPRREGNADSSNGEAHALSHSGLIQGNSIHPGRKNATVRFSEGQDESMYPLEEKLDMEEVRVFLPL
ncbi:uncharacterized protein PHACADRAFT_177654, partial [Phanerochaete carnosa HHB-10118-sp]